VPGTPEVVADDPRGQVISDLDAVTAVTERETNKVMDQLDLISGLVGKQQDLITEVMRNPGAQDPSIQEAVNQVMAAGKDIQNKVYEAMDLMQFQDITRQKLERIVHHLRQIHDYIVELLGSGLKAEGARASISRTIATTGTTPDENRSHADSVVDEFKRSLNKD
jgi:chemotaxis regulatin CheY-phosphate phosphatase CheZ